MPLGGKNVISVHFHVCVVDGVLEDGAGNQASPSGVPGVIFHPASAIDEVVVQEVQATLRRRILRAFVGRGLLQSFELGRLERLRFRRMRRDEVSEQLSR